MYLIIFLIKKLPININQSVNLRQNFVFHIFSSLKKMKNELNKREILINMIQTFSSSLFCGFESSSVTCIVHGSETDFTQVCKCIKIKNTIQDPEFLIVPGKVFNHF